MRRRGYTRIELVVTVAILALLLTLGLPAIQAARERSRRAGCANNLKLIGLAIHNYGMANRVFPPGTVCASGPISPANQYDVWAEAGRAEPGNHGTGFLLRILPFMAGRNTSPAWDDSLGICSTITPNQPTSNLAYATTDVPEFYCPARRGGVRRGDVPMMLSSAWTGGGTDYGGCAGRHAAFTLEIGYNLCDASMRYKPEFCTTGNYSLTVDTEKERWGIFGRVNVSTQFGEVKDGLSNTIMTGELQRITDLTPASKDGWAIGGPATLFTNGAMFARNGKALANVAPTGLLMNNGFFGSPGSDHPGGAHFGFGDGSVTFLSNSIDPNVLVLLGSMADKADFDPGN